MGKGNKYSTGFLFSTPSLLSGAATVFNLAGNYYGFNSFETDFEDGFEADRLAIENDFKMVGLDICDVINKGKSDFKKINLIRNNA